MVREHEKMFNISDHYRNASQTTVRYYLTPVRMAAIKKSTNNILARMWRKGNSCAVLVELQTGAVPRKKSMEPHNKNRYTI